MKPENVYKGETDDFWWDEEDSAYCACDLQLTEEEEASNRCRHCGKWIE